MSGVTYLQCGGHTEAGREDCEAGAGGGPARVTDSQESEDPGQPQQHRDADSVLETLGDLLSARRLGHLEQTAHDQDEGDEVVQQDDTDGHEETDVQDQIRSQETTGSGQRKAFQ